MSDETLCRTCLRPITHETRTEPGYLPREGWYDDARVDALVCFKAVDYRHVPLTDRERAYYDAGRRAALAECLEQTREAFALGAAWAMNECDHDWLDRPESDTRECLICGVER